MPNPRAAIARIFDNEDKPGVVGTGFLVAPGYVITCAHVVLEAMGIERNEFSAPAYQEIPTAEIYLDFPVEASGQTLRAKVVVWEPYELHSGDIAGLKLLDPVPHTEIQPIRVLPMKPCRDSDRCVAYGFADDSGGTSDAYFPRTEVAGGRWQLYKVEAENDDRIRPGFSGSPVFKRSQDQLPEDGYVAGMIATAQSGGNNAVSRAHAIPQEVLQRSIDHLFAHRLYDLVEEFRKDNLSDSDRWKSWVERAFRYCDACYSGEDLSLDLLPRLQKVTAHGARQWKTDDGQDVDRLTQWALFLALANIYGINDVVRSWVESRGSLPFGELYERADNYRKNRNQAIENCRCILVEVTENDALPNMINTEILAIDDKGDEHEITGKRPVKFFELGKFIDIELDLHTKFTRGEIHLFVPKSWISQPFDLLPLGEDGALLGSEYALLMRCNEPFTTRYRARLEKKWNALQSRRSMSAREVFKDFNCCDSATGVMDLEAAEALLLKNVKEEFCSSIVRHRRAAFPLILWARHDELNNRIRPELLENSVGIADLPEHVRVFRRSGRNQDSLGRHLSLVWQDPNLTPSSWERLG